MNISKENNIIPTIANMKNNLNSNKILLLLIVLLIIITGMLLSKQSWTGNKTYYAVLTTSGDLFFGQYHSFPKSYLTDVWTLQKTGNEQNPVALTKFDKAFWGPEDRLELGEKTIIWMVKLKADSPVLAQMKNASLSQGQNPTQNQTGLMPGGQVLGTPQSSGTQQLPGVQPKK
ncbi:MAG: hypothetical protein WAX85_00220 [Minisyncoccia bacterium]